VLLAYQGVSTTDPAIWAVLSHSLLLLLPYSSNDEGLFVNYEEKGEILGPVLFLTFVFGFVFVFVLTIDGSKSDLKPIRRFQAVIFGSSQTRTRRTGPYFELCCCRLSSILSSPSSVSLCVACVALSH